MIGNTFAKNREYIKTQYTDEMHVSGGMPPETLSRECRALVASLGDAPREIIKASVFEFILDNAEFEINPCNLFQCKLHHGNIIVNLRNEWKKSVEENEMADIMAETEVLRRRWSINGEVDFSHTCPDWDDVLSLGITGLLSRTRKYAETAKDDEAKNFYLSCEIVYNSVIRFLGRMADETARLSENNEIMRMSSESIRAISLGAPENMLEAMQLTFIFNYLQTYVEGVNLRSIGGIDRLYYKFYKTDIESGRFTEEEIREITCYWFFSYTALSAIANTPFYLCGLDENGETVINELSYLFIDEYDKLDVIDPKIHIRYTPQIPAEFIKKVLGIIAEGRNSIVFLNDEVVIKSLIGIGEDEKDARNYVPIGCYEPAAMGKEVPCTCAGKLNIPKAVELALTGGYDMIDGDAICPDDGAVESFSDFTDKVKRILARLIDKKIELINAYERNYMKINPAPLYSAAMEDCVKNGRDAYAGGAKYNNTSINAFGLAEAVDSIVAVKKLVFDEKRLSFEELVEILKADWSDNEPLRLFCKNKLPKYGNNNAEADEVMLELTEFASSYINGKPNGRGGVYRCGMFSIDWYTPFGEFVGATPSGRLAKTPVSKNLNPVIGADRGGVTSLINSVSKIDYTKVPNGAVLDLLLHSSVTRGEEGRSAMLGILRTYMKNGGFAIQFNALNPNVLKKAQSEPEKYQNLQIRLCGWNVYFVNLSRAEQDEFIKMSECSEASL